MKKLLIAALISLPIQGQANSFTGDTVSEFYNKCTQEPSDGQLIYCMGYIRGFLDSLLISRNNKVCVPDEGVSPDNTLAAIYWFFSTGNKDGTAQQIRKGLSVRTGLYLALANKYKCKSN